LSIVDDKNGLLPLTITLYSEIIPELKGIALRGRAGKTERANKDARQESA